MASDGNNSTCCFNIFSGPKYGGSSSKKNKKNKSAKDLNEEVFYVKEFVTVFEQYLPQYASSMEWVESFLILAKKVLTQNVDRSK
jgi:hypothetical protein